MKVSAGQNRSRIGGLARKHQRIVGSRAGFNLQHSGNVRQRATHRPVHLRHATQTVGILHARTVLAVRLANLRALQQTDQVSCRRNLAGITERRIDRLLNPDVNEGLPAFLSTDPGLSSGFMIAQIVAAALINECQVLAHPSSTGSIPTDGGKEDHVSMGMTGAIKLRQIVEHAERIVAIELMCAAQALEFRRPLRSSPELERVHDAVRAVVPRLEQDRVLATDVDDLTKAVRSGSFDAWCGEG